MTREERYRDGLGFIRTLAERRHDDPQEALRAIAQVVRETLEVDVAKVERAPDLFADLTRVARGATVRNANAGDQVLDNTRPHAGR